MKKSDCFSCHFIEEPSYGPPYLKIAARYQAQDYVLRDLGAKVQTGGGGLWGGAQMSRHRFLKDDEVDAMVSWVLSVAERESKLNTLYDTMPAIALSDKKEGMHISVYSDEKGLYPKDSTQLFLQQARRTGHIAQYFFDAKAMAVDIRLPVVIRGDGVLTIKSAGKYFFRLRGKKTGTLYIAGTQIISILETD
ncbi:MAG: c-type cytochrome, partial [Rhodothermales bacterium]